MNETLEATVQKASIEDLFKPIRVLFVCTGNTCRSPMAAAVTNAYCGGHVKAFSAGLAVFEGMQISQNAVTALENAGIKATPDNNYPFHTATAINKKLIEDCDRVYGISSAHTARLITAFPEYASKLECMPSDIPDPFGGDLDDYERCLDEIIKCVKEIFHLE